MPESAAAIPASAARPLGWLLMALILSELLSLYTSIEATAWLSKALVLLMPLMAWRSLRLREIYLLSVCLALLGLAWLLDHPVLEFAQQGLTRSAYFASFILLMALMREGALTSPSVLEVGTFLTKQPAKRRFLTLFGGGHFFGVLVNLGALSLLAPIIQRGVRAVIPEGQPLDDIAEVRERRQISAALRGFSWFLLWAPTAVTQAILPKLLPEIDHFRLVTLGLGLTVLMCGVSWLEDILRWRGYRQRLLAEGRLPLPSATRLPLSGLRNLGLVSLGLFGLMVAFSKIAEVTVVTGVMLAAPLVVFAWIFAQQGGASREEQARATGNRLKEIAFGALPGYFREAVFIACAGFIGTVAAKLVSAPDIAAVIGLEQQPAWLILTTLTAVVWLFGQVGLSPITMAVFLGSLVAELPSVPVDVTLCALAIAAGTAVCTGGAPFSSGVAMLARATGYGPMTLSWRWNGVYTVASMVVLALVYALLTRS